MRRYVGLTKNYLEADKTTLKCQKKKLVIKLQNVYVLLKSLSKSYYCFHGQICLESPFQRTFFHEAEPVLRFLSAKIPLLCVNNGEQGEN